MTSTALSFLCAVAVSAALTPLVRAVATRRGLTESGDGKLKLHVGGIPRLGGVAVVVAFFVPLMGILFLEAGIMVHIAPEMPRFTVFCLGGVAIFALGVWDDLRGAGARTKLLVEVAIALAVWTAGFRIERLRIPLFGEMDLGAFGLVVTVLWIVGITNALNLVDGLDGLAAGIAFFAAVAHVVIGAMNGSVILTLFAAALAGAVLGFLPYNLHPARIFIGDSGSLFLGYVLAMASIYGANHKAETAVAVLAPILILGLPILDTALAIVRRGLRGQSLFDGDREHVHHRMLAAGLSQRGSVLLLYALCAAFALTGLVATAASSQAKAAGLVSLLVVLVIFERRAGFMRKAARPVEATDTGNPIGVLHDLRRELAKAASLDETWEALVAAAADLDFHRMRLLAPGRQQAALREWARPGIADRPRDGSYRFSVGLGASADPGGLVLEVEKRPLRRGWSLPDQLFAELFQEHAQDACLAEAESPIARSLEEALPPVR